MNEINSYILKLQGKAELPEEIEISENYHVSLEGSITSYSLHDNQNGTYDKIFTFKPIKVDLLTNKGKSLHLKDTRSSSQLFRGSLYKNWLNSQAGLDFDTWYVNGMLELIKDKDTVAGMYFPK